MLWTTKNHCFVARVPKVEVWAIIEALTSVLNHVVIAFVMNQSQGH